MWGNKLGWAISVALVVAMAAAVAGAYVITSKRTPPTAFVRDGAHLGSIDLPINPKTLMMPQSRDEDAGIIYRRAINDYTSNQSMYAQLAKRFDVEKAELLIGVSSVLQAADYQKADIFPENQIDQVVSYNEKKQIAALQSVGGMCINIGIDYAKKKKYDEARRYLNSAFVLGYNLFNTRVCKAQLSAGLGLMATSATIMKQLATVSGDKDQVTRWEHFVTGYQIYNESDIKPVDRAVSSIDPKVAPQYVGDVFEIALNSKERVWRVEAVLKLGMYKFNTNTPGDRRAAIRTIKELYARETDPAVKAAALAAKELTLEQYRTLGSY